MCTIKRTDDDMEKQSSIKLILSIVGLFVIMFFLECGPSLIRMNICDLCGKEKVAQTINVEPDGDVQVCANCAKGFFYCCVCGMWHDVDEIGGYNKGLGGLYCIWYEEEMG